MTWVWMFFYSRVESAGVCQDELRKGMCFLEKLPTSSCQTGMVVCEYEFDSSVFALASMMCEGGYRRRSERSKSLYGG